jgi:hypothetical protein
LTLGLTAELSGTRDPEHALHPATAQVVDQLVASRDCGGIQLMMELSTSQTQGDRAFRKELEHAGRLLGCTG